METNSDAIVLEILKKLDKKLIERNIVLTPELKEVLVAEAQKLAREYATQGVEIGFKEIHDLIDQVFPDAVVVPE